MSLYWLTPSPAVADVPPAWQLSFTAPAACSTEEDFRRALDDRPLRAEEARAINHRIIVSISPTGTGWTGQLVVESGADGVRVERSAQATTCAELVSALALMVALILDLEPPSTPEAPELTPRLKDDSGPLSPPPPVPTTPVPAPAPRAVSASTVSPGPRPRLTEGELGFMLRWRSVAGWRDRVSVAPSILWGSRTRRGLSPWLRVSGERVSSRVVGASGLGASLTWTVAQLEGCSHKWAPWETAFLSPCARISIGALQATGDAGVDTPRELTRLWLTGGAGVEAAIPLVGPLWLRMQGGVEALLLRQRVYADADPDHIIIEMPAVLGLLGLGLGVRIW